MTGGLGHKGLIVLDRDGVINEDSAAYIKSAEEWRPLPGSIEAIAALHRAGYTVAVASNQSGLARGLFDRATLQQMHDKLESLVMAAGGAIDRIVVCPHGPDDGCDCRKPAPGLLEQLAAHYGTSMAGVPVVGDAIRDLEAARAVGARPILVRTGKGEAAENNLPADLAGVEVLDDLAAVAARLCAE